MLAQPAERRPSAETLQDLRLSCDYVISDARFGEAFTRRIAELVPPDHSLRSELIPVGELAVAIVDPVRDPVRYGGALEHLEARWQQLGAWIADLGMPADACHHLVRALARAARDVSGDDWDATSSSGWAALQLWMEASLLAGAGRAFAPTVLPRPTAEPAPGPTALEA